MPRHVGRVIHDGLRRGGGVRTLYSGVTTGVAKNALSTAMVIGMHAPMNLKVGKMLLAFGAGPLLTKIAVAQGLSIAANSLLVPFETIKTRLQADSAAKKANRRYTGPVDAFRSYTARNGVAALWSASVPTLARSALWWSGSIPVYEAAKEFLVPRMPAGDSAFTHLAASMVSGLCGTIASHPMDTVKTKMQNQSKVNPTYRSTVHCLQRTVAREGFAGLFRGVGPRYARLGPCQVVFFMTYEQLCNAARANVGL